MNCPQCGRPLAATRDDHVYTESGLGTVILQDVTLLACATCNERLVVIPRLDGLHRAVAAALAGKRAPLMPREVAYLRKYLGWSTTEFARFLVETPETVTRWEDAGAAPQPLPPAAERLLRLMVSTTTGEGPLPLPLLLELGVGDRESLWLRMELTEQGWRRQPD
jgi:YgiT-type zinc finger domain-containing protein